MKHNRRPHLRRKTRMPSSRVFLLSVCSALWILLGCGGGTRGTGGVTFDGKVVVGTSGPVAGAQVTVLNTGDSDITDAEGNFLIQTDEVTTLQVSVRAGEREGTTTIGDIPEGKSRVTATLVVDETGSVQSKDVSIREDDDDSDREDSRDSSDGRGENDSSGSGASVDSPGDNHGDNSGPGSGEGGGSSNDDLGSGHSGDGGSSGGPGSDDSDDHGGSGSSGPGSDDSSGSGEDEPGHSGESPDSGGSGGSGSGHGDGSNDDLDGGSDDDASSESGSGSGSGTHA